jgi:hypothetical protein
MQDYRLYFLNTAGHIQHAIEFACVTDDDAIRLAASRPERSAMELWQGARIVRKFPDRPIDEQA